MVYNSEYTESHGRLLSSPHGFFILLDEPHNMICTVERDILENMAASMHETLDKISSAITKVLSWARHIIVRVYLMNHRITGIRVEEILLEAIVTKVEPYCSELRAAEGRVLKVIQRLFDGNTPQLDTRYVLGIPWSRRDIKRHWASSVHKKVKIRKSVLPWESPGREFEYLKNSRKSTLDVRHMDSAVSGVRNDIERPRTSPTSCYSASSGRFSEDEGNTQREIDLTKTPQPDSRQVLPTSSKVNTPKKSMTNSNSCEYDDALEGVSSSNDSDSALPDDGKRCTEKRQDPTSSRDGIDNGQDDSSLNCMPLTASNS